jgi:FHA domain
MVQLEILSGKMAGVKQDARHFPFLVGRSASAHLRLEEDGVWDEHLKLAFDPAAGFVMSVPSAALVTVNGKSCREAVLRNGDELALGALRLRFWLGAPRQRSLRVREWLTWTAFGLITAAQLVLIYRLVP